MHTIAIFNGVRTKVDIAFERLEMLEESCIGKKKVRYGINLVAELFGSIRPIFSDIYLMIRFGSPDSSVNSVRPSFNIGNVRFGAKIPSSVHH